MAKSKRTPKSKGAAPNRPAQSSGSNGSLSPALLRAVRAQTQSREFQNYIRGLLIEICSPGRLYQQALALRNGQLPEEAHTAAFSPMTLCFYTTLVLESAELSLAKGEKLTSGATLGPTVDLRKLAADQLGTVALKEYGLG